MTDFWLAGNSRRQDQVRDRLLIIAKATAQGVKEAVVDPRSSRRYRCRLRRFQRFRFGQGRIAGLGVRGRAQDA